jgi:hypothetical protein
MAAGLSPGTDTAAAAWVLARGAEGESTGTVPDFALSDVNPNSATHGTAVTPLSLRGSVSAWYFTQST